MLSPSSGSNFSYHLTRNITAAHLGTRIFQGQNIRDRMRVFENWNFTGYPYQGKGFFKQFPWIWVIDLPETEYMPPLVRS